MQRRTSRVISIGRKNTYTKAHADLDIGFSRMNCFGSTPFKHSKFTITIMVTHTRTESVKTAPQHSVLNEHAYLSLPIFTQYWLAIRIYTC